MKLWGGRFEKNTDQLFEEFGASIAFDHVLWQEDIAGSVAHIKGLQKAEVLTASEAESLMTALQKITQKIKAGEVSFNLADEDIHMNLERLLFQEVGELAGKVHTGRSRNDQVALDMRLFMRNKIKQIIGSCCALQMALINKATQNIDVILPGYTHLQQAQPIRLAHHWLAYVWMFFRDIKRLQQNYQATNQLPLGAGALAGSSFPVEQEYIAQLLQFDAIYQNSLDAVSDRDYLIEFLATSALIMMHLSKLCEELIIWSSQEFGFITLDDGFCTGSSMMPQKKNPDAAELIRGKTGRVYGDLISLLTTLKSLPLAYNKDMQEDKECVFDAIKTVDNCLLVMAGMIDTLCVNEAQMSQQLAKGFLGATELANYLVRKGEPFRQAHEIVGNIVKHCIKQQLTFANLTSEQWRAFSSLFDDDVVKFLDMQYLVEQPKTACGTSKQAVLMQILQANDYLKKIEMNLELLIISQREDFVT